MKFMKFMAEANAYKEDMFKYLKAVGFPEPIRKAAIDIADAFDLYSGGYGVLLLVRVAEVIMKATDAGTLDDPYNNPVFIKNKKPKEMTPEIIDSIITTFGKKNWIFSYSKDVKNKTKEILNKHLLKEPSLFDISEGSGFIDTTATGFIEGVIKKALEKLKEKNTPENIINIIRDINKKFPLHGGYVVAHTAELIEKAFKNKDTTTTLAKRIINWDIFQHGNDNGPTVSAIEKILNRNLKQPSLFDIQESGSSDKSFDKLAVEKLKKAKYPDAVTNAVMDIFKNYPGLTNYNSVNVLQNIAGLIVQNTGLGDTLKPSTGPQFTSKTDVEKDVSPKRLREVAWAIYADYNPAFTERNGRPKYEQESFKFIRQTLESYLINKKPSLFDI